MSDIVIKDDSLEEVGDNVLAALQGNMLIVVVDTTKDLGPSSTGKMRTIASSGGFTRLLAGLSGSIYIGRKNSQSY